MKLTCWHKDPEQGRHVWGEGAILDEEWRVIATAALELPTLGCVTVAVMQSGFNNSARIGLGGHWLGTVQPDGSVAEVLLTEKEIYQLALKHAPRSSMEKTR